ncbi:DUF3459 domain-containing protein, partial [Streptococcus suis]
DGSVLAYERHHGDERIVVALNLGADPQPFALPEGEVLASTLPDPHEPGLLRGDEGGVILVVPA